jgi:glycosyltransferase involved in cell wall biosynthesis
MPMAQYLMVLPFSPNAIRGRTVDILTQFMRYGEVDILYLDDGLPRQIPDGVRRVTVIPNTSKVARAFRILFGLMRGHPIASEFYNCLHLPRVLAEMDLQHYDVIYLHRLPLDRLHVKHDGILYDADDCWSHKTKLMAARVGGYQSFLYALDAVLTPRNEAAACNSAKVVLVTAGREARNLREVGVTRPIEVYTHGGAASTFPRLISQRDRTVLSFHGKLAYKPNEIALRILNTTITPQLDPGRFEMRIIGLCPPAFRNQFPALHFTGYVESILETLSDSDLGLFPLTISVGYPNKVMESLAAGVPLIVAPGVIEGLPPMPELIENGVYVREINDFTAEIERFSQLSLDRRRLMSENCRSYALRASNQATRNAQWDKIMEKIGRKAMASEPAMVSSQ